MAVAALLVLALIPPKVPLLLHTMALEAARLDPVMSDVWLRAADADPLSVGMGRGSGFCG